MLSTESEFMPQLFKGHESISVWMKQILNRLSSLEAQGLNVASVLSG